MTRERFLPFSKPCLGPREVEAVCGVLQTDWITTGPKNAEFEEKFKAYTGAACAVAMTSETSVMFALFRALGIGPGDEVITPSMTWVSLPNTAELFGAKPVFVDCDRDTLMISPEAAEAAITPRTKMIVPVHFSGAPFDRDGFRKLADRHGLFLLEDAAHALGT
ncbi:MAG: aminotransferase class I/II-fold pyridoxal phosphate-dependent enzyme [Thermoguttaceae bacterium]|nr:aminotransferase class I/II-fold pyridoxal phosphate-dependent enzyme [Thermoguttaceae bacterium]